MLPSHHNHTMMIFNSNGTIHTIQNSGCFFESVIWFDKWSCIVLMVWILDYYFDYSFNFSHSQISQYSGVTQCLEYARVYMYLYIYLSWWWFINQCVRWHVLFGASWWDQKWWYYSLYLKAINIISSAATLNTQSHWICGWCDILIIIIIMDTI